MQVKVEKWGDDLAVALPRAIVAEVGVTAGSSIELAVEGGRIIASLEVFPFTLSLNS